MNRRISYAAAIGFSACVGVAAQAVRLEGDGIGQALIYPYYTVQNAQGNGWNTYVSVVNHRAEPKVLRVRFREGRNGREVAGWNLYLAANDVWTAAIVPTDALDSSPAYLVTADSSCANPRIPSQGSLFSNAHYSAAQSDGQGEGLDRTREGYLEIIEMASLAGPAAQVVTPSMNGIPPDCAPVQGANVTLAGSIAAPSGGLSGTLTFINVNSGMDMASNAVALAGLTATPFYRNFDDPYPDFNAAEVDPRSHMLVDGKAYELAWTSGAEAVSSVMMASEVINEYVLDRGTASQTDWVLTYPTRRFFPDPHPLFAPPHQGNIVIQFSDRTSRTGEITRCSGFSPPSCQAEYRLGVTDVIAVTHDDTATSLLGSVNTLPRWLGRITDIFEAGWIDVRQGDFIDSNDGKAELVSLPSSTSFEINTGVTTTGRFAVRGLPVTGLALRTFRNGALICATGSCQGNYGGSFPHRYKRVIEPVAP
jgi:hypothetical protein